MQNQIIIFHEKLLKNDKLNNLQKRTCDDQIYRKLAFVNLT